MLAEQSAAPDFEVLDDTNNRVNLSAYRGQWIILYFFPKAMTPG